MLGPFVLPAHLNPCDLILVLVFTQCPCHPNKIALLLLSAKGRPFTQIINVSTIGGKPHIGRELSLNVVAPKKSTLSRSLYQSLLMRVYLVVVEVVIVVVLVVVVLGMP